MPPQREAHDTFHAMDPLTAFERFGQEEVARIEQTDASYEADLYQEAMALVLSRLSGKTGGHRETES